MCRLESMFDLRNHSSSSIYLSRLPLTCECVKAENLTRFRLIPKTGPYNILVLPLRPKSQNPYDYFQLPETS